MIPTPHISLTDKSQIAPIVLMPGDPLRAKYIAETYLTDVVQINAVRNMFGFTGTYKGKRVTVFGSGMGQPSIGIYSYELFAFYGVEKIIRIGSAGSYHADLPVYSVVLADAAYSETTYGLALMNYQANTAKATPELNAKIKQAAAKIGVDLKVGLIHSSDVFYADNPVYEEKRLKANPLCVEMESFALFLNAQKLGKQAACLLTISDNLVTKEVTTAEERQTSFNKMMEVALETALL